MYFVTLFVQTFCVCVCVCVCMCVCMRAHVCGWVYERETERVHACVYLMIWFWCILWHCLYSHFV